MSESSKPTALPSPELFRHRIPVQLRFNDVDILGHVNNTVYFSFYDTGKAHYFGQVRRMHIDWNHVETVIANVECAYIRPIFFSEHIDVLTRCIHVGHKSFTLEQMLVRDDGEIKSVCRTVMVSFDQHTGHAIDVPQIWRDAFADYEPDLTDIADAASPVTSTPDQTSAQ